MTARDPRSPTLVLTEALIERASVSPEDRGCQALMIERLEAIGFAVERLPFGPVENFWATRGREPPVFCFAGHTDVVPPGPLESWRRDPFRPIVEDGVLYGRGAADMKSGLAAMVTACEAFVHAHPGHRGTIAFLITSDEEGPSVDGTRRVAEWLAARGQRIDWCLVGEPSSGPWGTTSVGPAKQNTGASRPRVAQKFSTGPNGRRSTWKPIATSRSIISAWQPRSSGLTDARSISASVRASVGETGSEPVTRARPAGGAGSPTGRTRRARPRRSAPTRASQDRGSASRSSRTRRSRTAPSPARPSAAAPSA